MSRRALLNFCNTRGVASVQPPHCRTIVDCKCLRKRSSASLPPALPELGWDRNSHSISATNFTNLLEKRRYTFLIGARSLHSRYSPRVECNHIPLPRLNEQFFYHVLSSKRNGYNQPIAILNQIDQHHQLHSVQYGLSWYQSTGFSTSTRLPRMNPSLHCRQISPLLLRWNSNGTNKSPEEITNGEKAPSSTESVEGSSVADSVAKDSESSSKIPTTAKAATEAVTKATQELENRIKRVVGDLTVGDQISVALIAVFTTVLLLAPYAVRHMKQQADTYGYDDRLQTDDPVDEFAKLARREWGLGPEVVDVNNDATEDKFENNGQNQKFIELLLKDVLQSATVQRAAQEFVVQIIQSERFKDTITKFVKELWSDLVTDPETVAQVIKLLEIAITSEPIKNAVIELVLQIAIRETEFRAAMIAMIEGLGQDDAVRNAVVRLLIDAAHTTLNDPDILDHSMEFATDVVGDDIVQQTAGEALRKSVEHAVRPATTVFLTACGVGFLIFSVIALGYSRSSESEAVIFESAARSLQSNAATGILRIATWPFRFIQSGVRRATSFLWESIWSVVPTLPDVLKLWHKATAAGFEMITSLAVDAIALLLRCLNASGTWLSSNCISLFRNAGSVFRRYAMAASSSLGSMIASSIRYTVKSLECGALVVAEHAWQLTVNGSRRVGSLLIAAIVGAGSYIKAGVGHLIVAIESYWQRITSRELLDPKG